MQTQKSSWIFGYGSLIWRPDFPSREARLARLPGWHRAMCILSLHYRGCPDRPGLVLGLDRGGSCLGLAFRIAAEEEGAIRATLDARELITGVYQPRMLKVMLDDGHRVDAYGYVADRGHVQYCRTDGSEAAGMIRQGQGSAGSARDYLASTVTHLRNLGIRDRRLEALLRAVDGGPA